MTTRPIGSQNGAWLLSTVGAEDWRSSAACRTADPTLFDEQVEGEDRKQRAARWELAVAVCARCEVSQQCLASFERGIDEGIRAARRLPPIKPHLTKGGLVEIDHGTEHGAQQHRRRKEQPCRECLDACALAHRERDRKRAEREAARAQRTPCGTPGATKRHYLAGEKCDVCREARAVREGQQRAIRKQRRAG